MIHKSQFPNDDSRIVIPKLWSKNHHSQMMIHDSEMMIHESWLILISTPFNSEQLH